MSGNRSFSAAAARGLLRRARTATLSTFNSDDGSPYASLVNVATDVRGWPVILVSTLAWHTRNLLADPRASLMVAELPPDGDALTGARVTVMGSFSRCDAPGLIRRYLARHPAAELYASFGDFGIWRMEPQRAHAVAGFGRIETIPADEMFPSTDEMDALEAEALSHMNEDHADAIQRYAELLLGASPGGWKIAAIDPDGADLCREQESLRLAFDPPVWSGMELRAVLARLGTQRKD
ncbi:HugZ family protein [Aestuariivirga sp.]|jgi:putative heme iron utilization protein|uniref:HugZ family protein n=1 Tax=Aestuariivirga sp. TaxID=2650926 RepID=UPI00378301E6